MIFCQKCGSVMMPKKEGAKTTMVCMRCGFKKVEAVETKFSEKIENVMPLIDEECPKCGHRKARFWTQQTRAGDEGDTKFFKCEKCKHTWRDYN
jgi:DNA-directed RNA polymerase subunit M